MKITLLLSLILSLSLFGDVFSMQSSYKKKNSKSQNLDNDNLFKELFDRDYKDYPGLKENKVREIKQFSNILTRTAIESFKNGNLHFFDPMSGNNQCHIFAMYITELYNKFKNNKLDISISECPNEISNEAKYLTLNFFLNSVLVSNRKSIAYFNTVSNNIKQKKSLNKFINIFENNDLRQKAKESLATMTINYINDTINNYSHHNKNSKTIKELALIAQQNDLILENESLTTYPKFPGALLMLKNTKLKKIPFLIKVKIVCKNGIHYHNYLALPESNDLITCNSDTISKQDDDTVIVINGIALHDELSFNNYLDLRKNCSSSLFNARGHEKNITCKICTPCENNTNCAIFKDKLSQLNRANFNNIILSVAADFNKNVQGEFCKKFFDNNNNLDTQKLKNKFKESICFAENNGLCSERPHTFLIEHVHSNLLSNEINNKKRFVDTPQEEFLQLTQNK